VKADIFVQKSSNLFVKNRLLKFVVGVMVLALILVTKNQTIFLGMNYMGGERIQID
jgi:hypothetical protein